MRKWYYSSVMKLLMVILCFVGTFICVDATMNVNAEFSASNGHKDYEPIYANGYTAFQCFIEYHTYYQNEEYVASGATISEETIEETRNNFKQRFSNDYYLAKEIYLKSIDGIEDQEQLAKLEENYANEVKKIDDRVELQVESYRNSLIRDELMAWESTKDNYEEFSKKYDYFIYLSDGTTFTNTKIENPADSIAVVQYFAALPFYDTYKLAYTMPLIFGYAVDIEKMPESVSEVFIGINQEYYDSYCQKLDETLLLEEESGKSAEMILQEYVIGFALFFVGALYLMIVAGRTNKDEEIHFNILDGMYMDLYTVLVIGISAILVYMIALLALQYNYSVQYLFNYITALACSLALIVLLYLTTLSKRIKTHTLFTHTLVYSICHWFVSNIKKILNAYTYGEKDIDKQVNRILLVLVVIIFALFAIGDLFFIDELEMRILLKWILEAIICALPIFIMLRVIVMRYIGDLKDIKQGTKAIREGNLSYTIPPLKNGSLNEIADNINCLSDGLKTSVSEAVASEKTKVELVTNVSHDLKTPLTSIINYIDLLSKKNIEDEEARHYIEVITLKSNQLKKLVEDLFEITKAQNGQIDMDISEICIDDLVNQCLAEYEEDFENKGLEVRISSLEKKSIIYADGNKMYRVLSNLLGNIVKYAMSQTRVYIQFEDLGEKLAITFKNIANYEMKFDGSKMGERFVRGDMARSSDGNGLGLAIAKSFLELQGDSLSIVNDGDLFKVTIFLHKKEVSD